MTGSLQKKLKLPVILSSLLVLLLAALELVNRRSFKEGFPFTLFGILWLLPVTFFAILLPTINDLRTEKAIFGKPVQLVLKVAFMILIALLWCIMLFDQLPCFLGVPNCD